MKRIILYSFFDLIRSRWVFLYTGFFLLLTFSLLWLSGELSKVIISLLNIVMVLVPLVATMTGIMYYYNSREFTELLLAQPIKRSTIFLGQYIGVGLALAGSVVIGIGLPFLFWGMAGNPQALNYLTLLLAGVALSFVFSALAFYTGICNDNKIRGFGIALVIWLFLAIVYDGIFLLLLSLFSDYPLENLALFGVVLNPIDLARVLVILKLDISALLGFTGAVFHKFLGNIWGMLAAMLILFAWVVLPMWGIRYVSGRKDF